VPHCMVAAAFHHVPAKELGDLRQPIESDVLICSDHTDAVETTSDIVARIPNMRPLNAGELAMATPIESFTAVLLQLNMHYKTRVAVRLTGIPEPEGEADGGRAGATGGDGDRSGAAGATGGDRGTPTGTAPSDAAPKTATGKAAGRKGNGSSGADVAPQPSA
jgi:hypothetical protein